jgi:hypothetical protein
MIDAADLLLDTIERLEKAGHGSLPGAGEVFEAFEEVVAEQLGDCGRVLLPRLGIGQPVELPPRTFHLPGGKFTHPALTYWQFDPHMSASWLQTALLYPFENLDNWIVLVHTADIDRKLLTELRPPMIPRLRRSLESLDWIVVDQGGHEGGRMERHEFLEILGPRPWIRLEHSAPQGVVILQRWLGDELQERFSVQVDDIFSPAYWTADTPGGLDHLCRPRDWTPDPLGHPLETFVALDVLSDPYATLRRYLIDRFGFDVERLGPGVLWRDSPDELFEFDDEDDTLLSHMDLAIAHRLDVAPQRLTPVIDHWFEAMVGNLPVYLRGFGRLNRYDIPDVTASMRPPSRQRNPAVESVTIAGEAMFAALEVNPATLWRPRP